MWAISNAAAGTTKQKQMVADAQIIPIVIHILQNKSETLSIRRNGIWVVVNLLSEEDFCLTGNLVGHGIIPCLCEYLNSTDHTDEQLIRILLEGLITLLDSTDEAESLHKQTEARLCYIAGIRECGVEDTLDMLSYHETDFDEARYLLRMLTTNGGENDMDDD